MDKIKNVVFKLIETPTLISILVGSVLVFWQLLTGVLPPSVQIVFFAVFILLTGIPHGAIDHLVEERTAEKQGKSFDLIVFIAKYLLIMAFYGLMWYVLSSVSLLFFLLISAWHFGETDIEKAPNTTVWNITRFAFGNFVLLFILLCHVEETTPILERISQNNSAVMYIWYCLNAFKIPLLISILFFVFILFYFAHIKASITINKIRYGRLFLILILTYFLPLLPAFALYFGGWHALCSFNSIHHYISENNVDKEYLSPFLILKTWTKTLLFSFLAIIFLSFATWYWLHFLQTWDPLPMLFIFLSLITLPHLNVMHKMNNF
jgi:beta-carotene 15,15'-dioxygenase